MPKPSTSKIGAVTIRTGRNGGKQFIHATRTSSGMKRTFYDYPPATRTGRQAPKK